MVTAPEGEPRSFDPRQLDRIYDAEVVRRQRLRTRELLDVAPGDRVLDLGCGAGHLATELAADVGDTGRVVGLDRQHSMLAATARRAASSNVADSCDLAAGEATALPLTDRSCDRVVAVQVLEYVPDAGAALAEMHRVLADEGRAVIVDTDWRSCVWHTDDRDRTDAVLRTWEGHFVHPHLPAGIRGLAAGAGFTGVDLHALPLVETEAARAAYSLGMAATIERFVERRAPGLADGWREDVISQAENDTYFFSLTRFAVVLTP